MKKLIFVLILFTLIPRLEFAQSNEDCLICHDDPGFKGKVMGKTVSLNVNQKTFSGICSRRFRVC